MKVDHRVTVHNPMTDAQPAMDHVRLLVEKGMPVPAIVEKCGVAQRTIYGFYNGYLVVGGARKPVKMSSRSAVAAVLAVEFEEGWDPKDFSPEKFRQAREARNLSRRGLAQLSGLSEWTFQWWEEGRSKPTRKKNMDAAMAALQVDWSDVSGPLVASDDEAEQVFTPNPFTDIITDYPCMVCGSLFRSRRLLAEHPHPKRKVSA